MADERDERGEGEPKIKVVDRRMLNDEERAGSERDQQPRRAEGDEPAPAVEPRGQVVNDEQRGRELAHVSPARGGRRAPSRS